MSDDSAPDNPTDPQDALPATAESAPESFSDEAAPQRGRLRQVILICLLGLMLLALAYDYRIARPNVEKAFDQIVKLNDRMNLSAAATPTLNTDIHKEIGRDPADVYTEGEGLYRIEVFSWTAGLPFRTHNLYAVYMPKGNDLVFMRHYKFVMPDDELISPGLGPGNDPGDDSAGAGGPPGPGDGEGPAPGDQGEGRPNPPGGGGQGENPSAEEGSPVTPDSEADAPAANAPSSDAAPDAPLSTPEASATPVDNPTAEAPSVEADPASTAGEAKKDS